MRGLNGKTAIVTGGTRGIGLSVAARLLKEGVRVLITGRNAQTGLQAVQTLQAVSRNIRFIAGDMRQEDFCIRTVANALDHEGRLDYLLNNAFPFTAKGLDASREDWIRTMETGPIAYATMIKAFVDQRGIKDPGAIVNMCSISAHVAQPHRWTYNAAKGAVLQLTRCAALDLSPFVRVNSISPGWVWTDEVAKATHGEGRAKWEPVWGNYHMLRRLTEPEEIASAVAFLFSDEASFITGADLDASGGYLAMGSEGLGHASSFAGSD